MRTSLFIVPALALAAFAAFSSADIIVVSRHSELTDSFSGGPPSVNYGETVSTDDPSAGTITAPHGASFVSSITGPAFHAELHGSRVSGGSSGTTSNTQTAFEVIFQVINNAETLSVEIFSGGSSPYAAPQSNVNLTVTNTGTSQVYYDLRTSTSPSIAGIPPSSTWSPQTFAVSLPVGTYRLYGFTAEALVGGGGGGSQFHSGGALNFTATLTPTPGASLALGLGLLSVSRRRR